MKYFTNCKTIEEAKKLYRRLAMENHPDRGGDLDTMKAVNAEYDEFFNTFKAQHNATAKPQAQGQSTKPRRVPPGD